MQVDLKDAVSSAHPAAHPAAHYSAPLYCLTMLNKEAAVRAEHGANLPQHEGARRGGGLLFAMPRTRLITSPEGWPRRPPGHAAQATASALFAST